MQLHLLAIATEESLLTPPIVSRGIDAAVSSVKDPLGLLSEF